MSDDTKLSDFSTEQLIGELRGRGLVPSVWDKEDMLSLLEMDDDFPRITDEQRDAVCQAMLDKVSRGLEDVLANRGNEYLGDQYEFNLRDFALSTLQAGIPKV